MSKINTNRVPFETPPTYRRRVAEEICRVMKNNAMLREEVRHIMKSHDDIEAQRSAWHPNNNITTR